RIGIELPIEPIGVGRAHEIAAHRAAFGAQGAVGHCGVPPDSVSNFRWDLERRVTRVEIAADRNRSIVVVESQKRRSWPILGFCTILSFFRKVWPRRADDPANLGRVSAARS